MGDLNPARSSVFAALANAPMTWKHYALWLIANSTLFFVIAEPGPEDRFLNLPDHRLSHPRPRDGYVIDIDRDQAAIFTRDLPRTSP